MSQREYKIEKTYTTVRYEGDKQQGPSRSTRPRCPVPALPATTVACAWLMC